MLAAVASAQTARAEAATTFTEKGYFSVRAPAGWEKYGPVEEGRVEKFAVVPAREGFYVLSVSSPEEYSNASAKAYDSVLTSFTMLGR